MKLADFLDVPLDIVTEKLAFLGRTGSGKSYAAMKLAELLLEAGAQIVTLDPVGVWFGLRVGSHWNVYIFGGLYGDFPLEPTGGALIADLLIDRGISAVLDVSQFIRSEQIRFATDFIIRFYNRKKARPAATHIFLEECQEWIPQNCMGDEAKMLHHFERAWKIGRNFGIGGSLISQRPQEVNKKALNQAGTLFTFQMTGPQERKAIEAWTHDQGIDADIIGMLPKLRVGEPHVWSPSFLKVSRTVRILPKISADVSITPKVGVRTVEQVLTTVDVEKLKSDMAATVERAQAEDPRLLRRQLVTTQKELADAQKRIKLMVDMPILTSVLTDPDRELLKAFGKVFPELCKDVQNMSATCSEIQDALERMDAARPPVPEWPKVTNMAQRIVPTVNHERATAFPYDLGKCERAILQVLSQYPSIGCDSRRLTLLTGYRYSGGFKNSLGALRQAGLIEGGNTAVMRITQAGMAAGPFEPLPADMAAYWLSHRSFGACERAILETLLKHPKGLTAADLCAKTGYAYSGGFKNSLGNLRTAGVITGKNTEVMKASDDLF